MQELLSYEGNVEDDMCQTFQVILKFTVTFSFGCSVVDHTLYRLPHWPTHTTLKGTYSPIHNLCEVLDKRSVVL